MQEDKQQGRSLKKFLPLLTLLVLVVITIGLGAKVKDEKARLLEEKSNAVKQKRPPVNIVEQEMVPGLIRDRLNLPGTVEPWESLGLLAEVRGVIEEVLVEEGDHVKEGDLIARIDTSDYENYINSIKAEYNLATINLKRLTGLREQEIISESQIDTIKAEVQSLKADLAIAEVQLERCFIRSSISGVVNVLPAKKGLYLGVGDPVATILDIGKLKVAVGIPEADVDAVRKIDSFEINIEALDNRKIIGRKYFLAVAPESQAQVYRLELEVDNSSEEILPGMFARVEVVKEEYLDALSVPLYAVISRNNKHFVYVEEDNVARYREVELGILDGWLIQITKGLKPGENVIAVGHRSVDDGQRVNVVKRVSSPAEITK
jgi:membrane fusion protein (multidrug efflux system)